ncbi:hypothetical protein H632_c575p0 [Helicosporidium sp. ATCC 50920]|nr:hypothetical protein H632_c575p0 [Helicosporidium sp. ATCC 50920]|eukprot:KDD75642.1 hypothetical protein H632_c575p0 [Helicosporidium sp. ATCC 50920]
MATPDPSPQRLSMLSPETAHVRDAPQHLGSPIELETAVSTGIATPTARGRAVECVPVSTPRALSPCQASPSRIPSAIARPATGGARLPKASPLHPVFHGNSRDSYATVDSFPDEFGSGHPPSLCGSVIDFELPMRPLDSPSKDDADWQSDVGSQSTFSDTIAGLRRLTTASQRRLGFRSRTSGAREGEDWAAIGGSVGGGLQSSLDRAWMAKAPINSGAVFDARPLRASAPMGLLSRQETCIRAGTVRPLRLQGGEGLAVSLPDGLWPSAPLGHKRSLFLSRQLLDASDLYQ